MAVSQNESIYLSEGQSIVNDCPGWYGILCAGLEVGDYNLLH